MATSNSGVDGTQCGVWGSPGIFKFINNCREKLKIWWYQNKNVLFTWVCGVLLCSCVYCFLLIYAQRAINNDGGFFITKKFP